jgi:hypothetical protein
MKDDTPSNEVSIRGQIVEEIWSVYTQIVEYEGVLETTDREAVRLFGNGSHLDSFELVNFLLDVELKVNKHFGVSISLMDERAMSLNQSPFRTVQFLTDFIVTLIGESHG